MLFSADLTASAMKRKNLIGKIAIFYLLCGVIVFWKIQVFGEKLVYVPKENEELYGTWVNEEYNSMIINARWDWKSDGNWASYPNTTGEPNWKGKYSITEKWTDDSGAVWYKMTWKNEIYGKSGYGLIRIGDSGLTMETAFSFSAYPTKIDSTTSLWGYGGIYYRK